LIKINIQTPNQALGLYTSHGNKLAQVISNTNPSLGTHSSNTTLSGSGKNTTDGDYMILHETHRRDTAAFPSGTQQQTKVRRRANDTSHSQSQNKKRKDALLFLSNIPIAREDNDMNGSDRRKRTESSVLPSSDIMTMSVSSSVEKGQEQPLLQPQQQQQQQQQHGQDGSTTQPHINCEISGKTLFKVSSNQEGKNTINEPTLLTTSDKMRKKEVPRMNNLLSKQSSRMSTALKFLQNIPLKKVDKKKPPDIRQKRSLSEPETKKQSVTPLLFNSSIPSKSAAQSSQDKLMADVAVTSNQTSSSSNEREASSGFSGQEAESEEGASSDPSHLQLLSKKLQVKKEQPQYMHQKLKKVNNIEEIFGSSGTKKDLYYKLPKSDGHKPTRKLSTSVGSSVLSQPSNPIMTSAAADNDDHTSSSGDTSSDEDNEEGHIRRCHLTSKIGLPFVSCSYISSYSPENDKKRIAHLENPTPILVSNDGFSFIDLESNIDCTNNASIQQPSAAISSNPNNNQLATARNEILTPSPTTLVAPNTPTIFIIKDKKYTSYEQWFNHEKNSNSDAVNLGDEASSSSSLGDSQESPSFGSYDPLFLDDPNIRGTSNRKIIQLPGLISSTVPFIRKKDLKIDLNEEFKEKHPNVKISLSKIRALKKNMLRVCFPPVPFVNALMFNSISQENIFIECSTIALAVIYLEKLILKNVVTKQNRKLVAAACLFLAYKFNYEGGGSNREKNFSQFWESVEENLTVPKKQVIKFEFQVFAWLDFELNVPINDIYPHMRRLLNDQGLKVVEYIGEDLFNRYIYSKLDCPAPDTSHHHQQQEGH
jgi:hypothetical protein